MAAKRDYYEVLGLAKGASADEIKSAYRKLALQWHPDKWVNGTDAEKKTAEEKFKEASEAYSVLSDPDKKARYDQFGHAGMEGQTGGFDFSQFNLNDLLNNIFGGFGSEFMGGNPFGGGFGRSYGGGQARERVYRGRDIRTRVRLTLEEIARGCEKEISIERNEPCPECGGKGAKNASDIQTCPDCRGTGQVQRVAHSIFGQSISYSPCPRCGGEGRIIKSPCRNCSGTGLVRKKVNLRISIPAGVENGMQITETGAGHKAKNNGVPGDLLVVIEEIPHPLLKREGQNLFYTHVLSVTDAMLGTEISVPCLDGPYKVKVEPGTQSGSIIRLRGQGLPAVRGYGSGKGDLYVKFIVWIPRKLSRSEREMLESIRRNPSFTPDPNREDKALFDRMKENF